MNCGIDRAHQQKCRHREVQYSAGTAQRRDRDVVMPTRLKVVSTSKVPHISFSTILWSVWRRYRQLYIYTRGWVCQFRERARRTASITRARTRLMIILPPLILKPDAGYQRVYSGV